MLNGIKRFAHRLGIARRNNSTGRAPAAPTMFASEFDATWHGDHWQNLLASPLDARHYVMEDWAQPVLPAQEEPTDASPPPRRRRRWYEQ
ncbi:MULTISPECIES: hypothetical protein [Burkholderia]|uniref:Uncharacterized protein n=1 Tax=Burkholderia savannae TaxID=1637837 RepID=A0ABR5TFL2_9BURK|nr:MULTISPECIES: hypothetical protein [Burkholderia]AOJ68063.1 hypothetical protein WS78_04320 [Burkholderia savannae]AOJ80136.1 hypothetical protein WS86_05525 [Burkholderia savannae]AOK46358.1 hypothetical protein WT60_05475 [Burkholderia sp. MSMB617WGS]KGR98087.1 hypothetical protein X946_4451 [Burkholderia sp. ABCPW 111]KVG40446.1 hypothetical protein WS77_18080 [Burkholderia sp. MSMB0265]